jgi:hypothetical protein
MRWNMVAEIFRCRKRWLLCVVLLVGYMIYTFRVILTTGASPGSWRFVGFTILPVFILLGALAGKFWAWVFALVYFGGNALVGLASLLTAGPEFETGYLIASTILHFVVFAAFLISKDMFDNA